MSNPSQRLALLTGVSLCAFLAPTSAVAATPGEIGHSVSGANVSDELVISAIGDPATVIGVTVDDPSSAFAIVETGPVHQIGNATGEGPIDGHLTLDADNGGLVTIEAIANALNSGGGDATARAHVERGVYQVGQATTDSALDIRNSGGLAIVADAEAAGTAAHANATLSTGVQQIAAGPVASAAIGNQGSLALVASADAGATAASAVALASLYGINQAAHGHDSGLLALSNDGSISIGADAHAAGFISALADVQLNYGIAQSATGSASDGFAGASLANSGNLAVAAEANANAELRAEALADVGTAIYQHATGSGGGADASLANSGMMAFSAVAAANADNDGARSATAHAEAAVGGIAQYALAKTEGHASGTSSGNFYYYRGSAPHGPASLTLDNSGTIALTADASGIGKDDGYAQAAVTMAAQLAAGTDVAIALTNSGALSGSALALASGAHAATAMAFVSGVHQSGSAYATQQSVAVTGSGAGHVGELFQGVGPVALSLTNTGSVTMLADAHAVAGSAVGASSTPAFAGAMADIGVAFNQLAFGNDAQVTLNNDGNVALTASAAATDAGYAVAQADVDGFSQAAFASGFQLSINWGASGSSVAGGPLYVGPAAADVANTGAFDIVGLSKAGGAGFAEADVHAGGGFQVAVGETASLGFENVDRFTVLGSAQATGASEFGYAAVVGLTQREKGERSAIAEVLNSGTMAFVAKAHGSAVSGYATDVALVGGIGQNPLSLATATASLANSGTILFDAEAQAAGVGGAYAGASALGLHQDPLFGTLKATLANDGTFADVAKASAVAGSGAAYASAHAEAYLVDAANVIADITNEGSITAAASAVAHGNSGSAYAYAAGFTMYAANHLSGSVAAGSMAGTILNTGQLHVSAKVDSANGGTNGATATGIYMSSTRNNAAVVNTGLIEVQAVTAHDGPATAYGVRLTTGFRGDPAGADDLFTFTNDGGTIVVRQSLDGGLSWQHGMAIDVSDAPNASVLNLVGDGAIYGDIAVKSGDRIDVKAGTTYFDGVISPSFVGAGGVTSATLDSGAFGAGTLSIMDGGNLILADARLTGSAAMYDGPAYAAVDTLNVASDGTLTFDLQPADGGVQDAGSYGQVYADHASLDGALVAMVTPAGGLFADSYSWQNVIDANSRSGQFDSCSLGGGYGGSALLHLSCSYDSNANVDLALTRVAFNAVAGLTRNQGAVAGGIEALYDALGPDGLADAPLGSVVADLFSITPADYPLALDQLTGSAYAGYLQSFGTLGYHYNAILDRASDCEAATPGGSALECRSSPVHFWAQADHDHLDARGDAELARSDAGRNSRLVGLDVAVSRHTFFGLSGGYVRSQDRFDDLGHSAIKARGVQLAAYGVYDSGPFFVKALASHGMFDGNARRQVDFTPYGGATVGTIHGDADVSVTALGLHAGMRIPATTTSVVTPFVYYDHVAATLDGFSEVGSTGAELDIERSHERKDWLTGGAKWSGRLGRVKPEASLGWRHMLGGRRAGIGAGFSDMGGAGDFDLVSMKQDRDSAIAGLSLSGQLGPVDLSLSYQGAFGVENREHSGALRLTIPLGSPSRAASPPADPAP